MALRMIPNVSGRELWMEREEVLMGWWIRRSIPYCDTRTPALSKGTNSIATQCRRLGIVLWIVVVVGRLEQSLPLRTLHVPVDAPHRQLALLKPADHCIGHPLVPQHEACTIKPRLPRVVPHGTSSPESSHEWRL
jgi:hypothetical protein